MKNIFHYFNSKKQNIFHNIRFLIENRIATVDIRKEKKVWNNGISKNSSGRISDVKVARANLLRI